MSRETTRRLMVLAAALVCSTSNAAGAGELSEAFGRARVLTRFDTRGLAVAGVKVADNTVACILPCADSASALVAWDFNGQELFRFCRRDTTLPTDNGQDLSLWLWDVSADGSTFATSRGFVNSIVDRTGKEKGKPGRQGAVILSPRGRHAMRVPWEGICESSGFALFAVGDDSFLMGPDREHAGSFGVFLDDSVAAADAWQTRGLYGLPSGQKLADLPSIRVQSSAEGWISAVASPRGDRFAVIGDVDVVVFSTSGELIWDAQSGARNGTFDETGDFLCLATSRDGTPELLFRSFTNDDASFSVGLVPIDLDAWWEMSIVRPPQYGGSRCLVLALRTDVLHTVIASVDLPQKRLVDAVSLPAAFFAVPQRPGEFVRLAADSTGAPTLELVCVE